MSMEKRNKFHFFNSFFFRKLIDLDKDPSSSFESKAAFQRVRKWTRKVNLFEKDYVFIPVNYSYHWSLVVICHPGEVTKFQDGDVGESLKVPCILHMDSMKGSHTVLKDIVQSYLWEEWKEKNKDALEDMSAKFLNLRFVSLELPQQPNAYDCGLFLLHYVELFLEEAPINFSPLKITHYSKFLNLDWFRPEEPCLKRAHIQRLICKILEGEDIPAAGNSKPCALGNPANNNAIENNLESKRCSPLKIVHGNLSGCQSSEGIEITLLQAASSQYGGDSNLVLREFMEAGASAEPFLDVQYQTFDQAATFGDMGHMEDDVEACGQFVFTRSNINPDSVVPYLSNGLGADICKAENDDFREYPETSVAGSGNSSEVEIQKSNSPENTLIIEERFDEPRSPSAENPTPAPNQMLDVAGLQPGDQILNSHGTADNDLGVLSLPEFASQQRCNAEENGDVTCADIDLVRETLLSKTDEQQGSETVSEIFVSETNGMLGLERIDKAETAEQQGSETVSEVLVSGTDGMLDGDRIGQGSTEDDLVSESDRQLVAKRTGDVTLPESDELKPAKRLCLDSSPTEDELVSESDGQLAAKRTGDVISPESDEQKPAKRLCLDSS